MDTLKQDLFALIMRTCHLTEKMTAHYSSEAPLVGPDSPLGLDSIDAIEIGAAIQQEYGIRITDRSVFSSLDALAEHLSRCVDLN